MKRRYFVMGGLFGLSWLWARRFNQIVLHHSGGGSGNLEFLRQVHAERQAKDPIPFAAYHFVIGNGHGMGDGEIAPTRRWPVRLWGAHLSAHTPMLNLTSIGICLIGNFENTHPTHAQLAALAGLVGELKDRYHIPLERITGHRDTFGQQTLCPGRNFNVDAWKNQWF